jgi:drug/metabolite transporter (DMT)-like permease
MSPLALTLVLLASVTHAVWNFLAKKSNGGVAFIWLTYLGSTILFLPGILWVIMESSETFTFNMFWIISVSAILRLCYFMVLQTGYRKADLSVVYPVARGSAPLFSTLGAIIILNETPTGNSVAGLGLIITGVFVISKPKIQKFDDSLKNGLMFGTATGLLTGLYTLWDKQALTLSSPLYLTYASHALGVVVLAPVVFRQKEIVRATLTREMFAIITIAILSPLSYLLVLIAMKTSPVIYVAPAREVSIIFGVWLGNRLMSEKDTRHRIAGATLIFIGILFLAAT